MEKRIYSNKRRGKGLIHESGEKKEALFFLKVLNYSAFRRKQRPQGSFNLQPKRGLRGNESSVAARKGGSSTWGGGRAFGGGGTIVRSELGRALARSYGNDPEGSRFGEKSRNGKPRSYLKRGKGVGFY